MKKSILKLLFLYSVLFCISALGYEKIVLNVPRVFIDQEAQIAKKQFEQGLQQTAFSINHQHFQKPIIALAPLGGTKLTAFKELDLDGLVIVDWDRPGTPSAIRETFSNPDLRFHLKYALEECLNFGANSTSNIMRAAVSAQLLGRFWYELGVTSVRVQFYLPKNRELPPKEKRLTLWDGEWIGDADIPLVTRFLFNYQGQSKELVYVTSKVTSDQILWRSALPKDILQNLAPQKFQWGYLSADGLIFFSKKFDNGLSKGNQEFLELLTEEARVILEYPNLPYYNACDTPPFDGITAMCGRADLETWALSREKSFLVEKPVFGYAGFALKDEVRIYAKLNNRMKPERINAIFSFNDLIQVGEEYEFELVG